MKKSVFTIVVLISILAILLTTAANANGKSLTLNSTRFVAGKGIVLLFTADGVFSNAEFLDAYIYVDKQIYDLHCSNKSDTLVVCEGPGQLKQFRGFPASGEVAGFAFYTTIPRAINSNGNGK